MLSPFMVPSVIAKSYPGTTSPVKLRSPETFAYRFKGISNLKLLPSPGFSVVTHLPSIPAMAAIHNKKPHTSAVVNNIFLIIWVINGFIMVNILK